MDILKLEILRIHQTLIWLNELSIKTRGKPLIFTFQFLILLDELINAGEEHTDFFITLRFQIFSFVPVYKILTGNDLEPKSRIAEDILSILKAHGLSSSQRVLSAESERMIRDIHVLHFSNLKELPKESKKEKFMAEILTGSKSGRNK